LTPAEATLWGAIKNSRLEGRKFRRQHSVGNYVLDFYCPAEFLAVELDGEVHKSEAAGLRDLKRSRYLAGMGIKVLRFENFLVFDEPEFVLGVIRSYFGWRERESTTPSAEAASTPPNQGGELGETTTPSAEAASAPPNQGGELGETTTPSAEAASTPPNQGGEL